MYMYGRVILELLLLLVLAYGLIPSFIKYSTSTMYRKSRNFLCAFDACPDPHIFIHYESFEAKYTNILKTCSLTAHIFVPILTLLMYIIDL